MSFCSNCGAEVKDDTKFCDKCGAEIKTQNKNNPKIDSGVICPNCGATNPIGQKVCSKCGKSIEENTVAIVIGYICLWLFPILALIPGIYLLTRSNGKSKIQGLILLIVSIAYLPLFGLDVITGSIFHIIVLIIGTIIGVVVWIMDIQL